MRAVFLVLFVALAPAVVAHPWGGLVVDAAGAVYFTFVCPPVSENHVACVWRLAPGETEPQPALISGSDPSDMVLARTAGRVVYAAERVGSHPFRARLWRFDADGRPEEVLPLMGPRDFTPDPYTVTDGGTIYFQHDGAVWSRTADSAPVRVRDAPERLSNLEALADGTLVSVSGGELWRGTQRIARNLKRDDPPGLPFSGANILFDLAIDGDQAYLAYYGNREVLRVGPSGSAETLLEAESPWSPSGVDVFEGTVYVLESVTPAPAWKFWQDSTLRPRVRAISPDGSVRVVWEFAL